MSEKGNCYSFLQTEEILTQRESFTLSNSLWFNILNVFLLFMVQHKVWLWNENKWSQCKDVAGETGLLLFCSFRLYLGTLLGIILNFRNPALWSETLENLLPTMHFSSVHFGCTEKWEMFPKWGFMLGKWGPFTEMELAEPSSSEGSCLPWSDSEEIFQNFRGRL